MSGIENEGTVNPMLSFCLSLSQKHPSYCKEKNQIKAILAQEEESFLILPDPKTALQSTKNIFNVISAKIKFCYFGA